MICRKVEIPKYVLKDEYRDSGLPNTVSFHGAFPHNRKAYKIAKTFTVEMVDAQGRVTYSNYFFGKTLRTEKEFDEAIKKLNKSA